MPAKAEFTAADSLKASFRESRREPERHARGHLRDISPSHARIVRGELVASSSPKVALGDVSALKATFGER